MTGTLTWVGMDVHARSTQAAAIDLVSGEVARVRFGPGVEAPVAWLSGLPGPVHACYEAGPTGFGLFRARQDAARGLGSGEDRSQGRGAARTVAACGTTRTDQGSAGGG